MCAIEETVTESFAFIGDTEAAAEVEDGIVIIQREGAEELFQFLKAVADFCRYFVNLSQVRYEHPYHKKEEAKASSFLLVVGVL